jgi:Zinc-binding dehydrogenase
VITKCSDNRVDPRGIGFLLAPRSQTPRLSRRPADRTWAAACKKCERDPFAERGLPSTEPTSGRVVDLLEAVDDQVEPQLERAHLAVGAFAEVLLGVLVEVRVVLESDRLRDRRRELRDLLRRVGVIRLPEREAEDVRVEDVDYVIDYTREDFTRSSRRYDLILDIAGSRSWSHCKRVLNPDATLVIVGGPKSPLLGPLGHIAKVRLAALRVSQRAVFFMAKLNRPDLDVLRELLESGSVTPVVEKRYELGDVADALRYMGEGHARGKNVINV